MVKKPYPESIQRGTNHHLIYLASKYLRRARATATNYLLNLSLHNLYFRDKKSCLLNGYFFFVENCSHILCNGQNYLSLNFACIQFLSLSQMLSNVKIFGGFCFMWHSDSANVVEWVIIHLILVIYHKPFLLLEMLSCYPWFYTHESSSFTAKW